jgi:hypothetical protein
VSEQKPSIRPYIKISLDKVIEQHGDRILSNEKRIDTWDTKDDEREKRDTKQTRWVAMAVTVAITVAGAGVKAYFDIAAMQRDIQTVKNSQKLHREKHITTDKIVDMENDIQECSEAADARLKTLEKLHPRRRTK